MKASDIREQTVEELETKLNDTKKSLFNLKFQKAIGQLENTQAIGNFKRDIARIETLIREKELGINLQVKVKKKSSPKKKASTKKSSTEKKPAEKKTAVKKDITGSKE